MNVFAQALADLRQTRGPANPKPSVDPGLTLTGTFPDGRSALMLVTARLKYVAESEWGSRRYLDVSLLDE